MDGNDKTIGSASLSPVDSLEDMTEILVCPAPPRPGETLIDLVVALAIRAALIIQFGGWALGNSIAQRDLLDWQSWFIPEDGLVMAVRVWTQGYIDPMLGAYCLIYVAALITLSAVLGLFARLSGLLIVLGVVWHVIFVLPEAWPVAFTHGVLGIYLALRGAGPVSMDWILARLSRIG